MMLPEQRFQGAWGAREWWLVICCGLHASCPPFSFAHGYVPPCGLLQGTTLTPQVSPPLTSQAPQGRQIRPAAALWHHHAPSPTSSAIRPGRPSTDTSRVSYV